MSGISYQTEHGAVLKKVLLWASKADLLSPDATAKSVVAWSHRVYLGADGVRGKPDDAFAEAIDHHLEMFEDALSSTFFPDQPLTGVEFSVCLTVTSDHHVVLAAKLREDAFARASAVGFTAAEQSTFLALDKIEYKDPTRTYHKGKKKTSYGGGGGGRYTKKKPTSLVVTGRPPQDRGYDMWKKDAQERPCFGTTESRGGHASLKLARMLAPHAFARRFCAIMKMLTDAGVDHTRCGVVYSMPKWMRAQGFHLKCSIPAEQYLTKFCATHEITVASSVEVLQQRFTGDSYADEAIKVWTSHRALRDAAIALQRYIVDRHGAEGVLEPSLLPTTFFRDAPWARTLIIRSKLGPSKFCEKFPDVLEWCAPTPGHRDGGIRKALPAPDTHAASAA